MSDRGISRNQMDPLTSKVISCAIEVHRELGPGLLESAYEECLCHELALNKMGFEKQVPLAVAYKGVKLECGYRMDIVVEKSLIVEAKTVEEITRLHQAQLLTYLKLSGIHTGLILNFNVPMMKDGLKRMVH